LILLEHSGLNITRIQLYFTPIPAPGAKKNLPFPGQDQQTGVWPGIFSQSNNPVAGVARHSGNRPVADGAAFSSR